MEALSGTDALAVMNSRNDGYGYGDGMYGSWFWIIIILFAFWGNGFGGRGTDDIARESTLNNQFTQRDIFNTNTDILTSANAIQRDVLENRYTNQLCCCETQKEVLENRYNNALGQANLQKDILLGNQNILSSMNQCCCDLKVAIHQEGEETRALITQNTIQDLRDRLSLANNTIASQTLANNIVNEVRPFPSPSYVVGSPYQSYYGIGSCGCVNNVI